MTLRAQAEAAEPVMTVVGISPSMPMAEKRCIHQWKEPWLSFSFWNADRLSGVVVVLLRRAGTAAAVPPRREEGEHKRRFSVSKLCWGREKKQARGRRI